MRSLSLVTLLVLAHATAAQPSIDYGPVQPDRTPLAAAQDVPFALLLGLGGTSALFVNPARAVRSEHEFVYGTVNQTPIGVARPVSLSALIGSHRTRWLITAQTYAGNRNREDVQSRDERFDSPGVVWTQQQTRTSDAESIDSGARGRVLLTGRSGFGGYAFGLFGGYQQLSSKISVIDDRVAREERTQPFVRTQRLEQMLDARNEERLAVYGIGVEVALAGRSWDLATSVSYQGGRDRDRLVDTEDRLDINAEEFSERTLTVESEQESVVEAAPQGVGFEVLGTLRTGVSRDDYLFASASGAFLSGAGDYEQASFFRTVDRVVEGDEVFENRSLQEFDEGGEVDLSSRVLRFSLGYVYAHKRRSARVLAGVIPTVSLDRIEAIDGRLDPFAPDVTLETFDILALGVQMPLHVQLPIRRSLTIFGGGVYSYDYLRDKRTVAPLTIDGALPEGVERSIERTLTATEFVSQSRLYGGALLALRSGLTAQAALRGDLADFDRWTVSLGYRF